MLPFWGYALRVPLPRMPPVFEPGEPEAYASDRSARAKCLPPAWLFFYQQRDHMRRVALNPQQLHPPPVDAQTDPAVLQCNGIGAEHVRPPALERGQIGRVL